MKLRHRSFDFNFLGIFIFTISILTFTFFQRIYPDISNHASANSTSSDQANINNGDPHFVTIYDKNKTLRLKTTATTVGDLLSRIKISVSELDIVEPDVHAPIDSDHFNINIYRSRPVLVSDQKDHRIIETASFDEENIVKAAGFTIFDGDTVDYKHDTDHLLSGVSSSYEIKRSGGSVITAELSLPAPEEKQEDNTLKRGETKLLQIGEDGRKVVKYRVKNVDQKEVSRELMEEKVIVAPKPRIVAVGTKVDTPEINKKAAVTSGACVDYARAAGVSEADLPYALDLINKESRCNPYSRNVYSGAYGIPQALPGNKMASAGADWETNPVTQIRWMIGYVTKRYGGWRQALEFWHCIGTCNGINKRSTWY